ncbi:MAG: AMP-binding protein [Erysipelotrichaceae bacterium]|nr:AMP-binding protein [Erysipelotrichaceae bacterium]
MKNGPYPYYEMPDIKTLRELVEYGKESRGDKPFLFNNNDEPISSKEFSDIIKQLGTFILGEGLNKFNIGLVGENTNEWFISFFSIINSGNVIVPLDRNLSNKEKIELIERCECKALFYSKKDKDLVEELKNGIKCYPTENIYEFAEEGRKKIENGDDSYDKLIIDKDDLAAIVFTSGTSGAMKGVMLSHYNLMSDSVSCCKHVVEHDTQIFLPLHHTFPWASAMFAIILCGGTVHFSSNMRRIMKDLQNNHPQNLSAVPMMVEMIHNGIWVNARKNNKENKLKAALKLSRFLMSIGIDKRREIFKEIHDSFGGNLEVIICGGAGLDTKIEKDFYDFGIQILIGYGITECSPVVAVNRPHDYKFGSVGKILPCNKVKIADPDKDGAGEILVSGTNVMKGYYKDPESTAEAFDGEWFKTGDYGMIDEDGFLFITGRKKNLIILSNGENVSPEGIEQELMRLPYVKEVVVYEEDGHIVGEFYLDDENYSEAKDMLKNDVDLYNRSAPKHRNLARFKIRNIPFVKTTTMKIKRYLIDKHDEKKED